MKIYHEETIYCIIVNLDFEVEGVKFLTSPNEEFQIGLMKRDKSNNVKRHRHLRHLRTVQNTTESLLLLTGSMLVTIWTEDNIKLKEITVNYPSLITLFRGYHEFEFLTETKLIEIKQGPYMKNEDKVYE